MNAARLVHVCAKKKKKTFFLLNLVDDLPFIFGLVPLMSMGALCYWENPNKHLTGRLLWAEVFSTLYTDALAAKKSAYTQLVLSHTDRSGPALFPETWLLFGYGGNEMEAECGVGGTLEEMALHSDIQTSACDM